MALIEGFAAAQSTTRANFAATILNQAFLRDFMTVNAILVRPDEVSAFHQACQHPRATKELKVHAMNHAAVFALLLYQASEGRTRLLGSGAGWLRYKLLGGLACSSKLAPARSNAKHCSRALQMTVSCPGLLNVL